MKSKYKGFKLLIEYPGCNKKVGDFVPLTTGEFFKYPKLWEPVYTDQELRKQKLKKLDENNLY